MKNHLLHLPRIQKQSIVGIADIFMSLIATWGAFSLRLDVLHWPEGYQWHVYQLAPLLALPVFTKAGLYRAVFRYNGMSAMVTVGKAVAIYGALFFAALVWLALPGIPRSVGLLQPILFLILVASSRAFARFWLLRVSSDRLQRREVRILIYGAGAAGAQIADALLRDQKSHLVGFLDDDPHLRGKTINGQRIYSPNEVESLIDLYDVSDVLLALPGIARSQRNEILTRLRKFHVHVRSLPNLNDLAEGKIAVSDIHELDINDLLGREPVPPNLALISRNISGEVVLVTGAGGSIGGELCRQILAAKPLKLLLLDHNEFGLYSIHEDLKKRLTESSGNTELTPLLASVRDIQRLKDIFKTYRPRTIYHAAAYKHVPLVEHNPVEGIRNNVFGTFNAASVAIEFGVRDFVLVSTDKAVRPTNIMGATKRLAEMILQAFTCEETLPKLEENTFEGIESANRTRFSMVRFGNVLGSSGSVVPLFRQQIREGGPITLTDLEVTRYFMTIPEAAQLVVQAAAMAEGGDVFVLDMGEPVKIADLAHRIVDLSGLTIKNSDNPGGDIEIKVTGMRPGEKLYEELLIGENPKATFHPRIMKAHEDFIKWDSLKVDLRRIGLAADKNDVEEMRLIIRKLVSGYQAVGDNVDWLFMANESIAESCGE